MKTIDEIIKRDDYLKMTASLRAKCTELADRILNKMIELDLTEFENLYVRKVSASGFSEKYLFNYNDDCCLNVSSSFYYAGNFNCWIQRASNKEFLNFLNEAAEIFKGLDNYETEKVKEIAESLENNKNL